MVNENMTTAEVLTAIATERERLLHAIGALGSNAAVVRVTDEGWTAKDVLAHLIHWATQIAFGLGADVKPPSYMQEERLRRQAAALPDSMPTGAESNALAVAHFAAVSFEEVKVEFERLVELIFARVLLRSDKEMKATDAIPWAGSRPLWQQIGSDTFLHWPVHAADIESAVRQ